MAKLSTRLGGMSGNHRSSWTISDVETVCSNFGLDLHKPLSGSHWIVSHPSIEGMLTIPTSRPIKPVYILLLIDIIHELEKYETV